MNNIASNLENNDDQNTPDRYDHDRTQDDEYLEQKDETREEKHKEGELLTFVRVRFPGNARSFPFIVGKRKFSYGQKVIAMSDRGMTVGYINSFPYQRAYNSNMRPVRSIAKTATQDDIIEQQDYTNQVKKAEIVCINLIDKLKLDMTLTHVEFIHFGKKAVFYFMAPERVDFRDLVKSLVYELKMRIELRQISLRDRTAALGGIGVCGLQTCCSSFLQNYGNVSIKMAKNQNLALIPSKVNGICGQLKCCIKYEDDVYTEKRSRLPREGELIKTYNGDFGKVTRLHLIIEQFEMLTSEGQKRQYVGAQYNPDADIKGLKYPEIFDNIVNETSKLVEAPEHLVKMNDDYDHENEDGEYDDHQDEDHDDAEMEEDNLEINLKSQIPLSNQDVTKEISNELNDQSQENEAEEKPLETSEEKEKKKNKFYKKQKRFRNTTQKRK